MHRNLTLLAVAFLGVHVVTTLADSYTPIGWKDAVVPFLSPYRPFWLGLGALALDLLLALVITSLLRARFGLRAWRLVALARVRLLAARARCTPSGRAATRAPAGFRCSRCVSMAAVLIAVAARLVRSGARLDAGSRSAGR